MRDGVSSAAARGPLPPTMVMATLAAIDRHFIPAEEARLAACFGEEYTRYRAGVRRWL